MRVLVVEDDKELNNFIRSALKREGFVVDQANDGKAALDRAEQRLAAGSFGRSIRSGRPIPDERLEADPAAELTVEEAAEE